MSEQRTDARRRLNVPDGHRMLLCLDGGGIRGMMTLQLLKHLEAVAGVPCHALFDLVAGTSTGGIIAGLILAGKTAVEVEQLYVKFVTLVFTRRSIVANRYLNPPGYTKGHYRSALKDLLGDVTLRDACGKTGPDVLLLAKDVAEGEETYFSCLADGAGGFVGAYQSVLLRAAMEATMSAPTYFAPLERFVDGGVTTFNNPTLAAITEAVRYGPKDKYRVDRMSVFSFGTGYRQQFLQPRQVADPPGLDVVFWLQWLMSESGADASDMQGYFLRGGLCPGLDYRRFQITLDTKALAKLPDLPLGPAAKTAAKSLHGLSDQELSKVTLDDVDHLDLMRTIGQGVVQFIDGLAAQPGGPPPFSRDLTDRASGRELLVTREGDVAKIAAQLGSAKWLDGEPT